MSKNYFKKITATLAILFVFCVPIVSIAAEDTPGDTDLPGITDPLSGAGTIPELITKIVDQVTQVGYYVIVIFILYSGFKFVTAQGNETEIGNAKKMFFWTVVGAAVLLSASIISTIIKNTIDDIKKPAANITQIDLT